MYLFIKIKMLTLCLGQRLDMLIKPMLYARSAVVKDIEICKMRELSYYMKIF